MSNSARLVLVTKLADPLLMLCDKLRTSTSSTIDFDTYLNCPSLVVGHD